MTLTFDAEKHLYYWNGKLVPSVTRVLAGIDDYGFMTEEQREAVTSRGTAVHVATQLYDEGDLDMASVDPDIAGYLDAWVKYREQTGFAPTHSEHRVYHPLHRYAGTVDRVGKVGGGRHVLLDIKTGDRLPLAVGPQLAGYKDAFAWADDAPAIKATYAVRLRADGTYDMTRYDDPSDLQMFLACLYRYRWLEEKAS